MKYIITVLSALLVLTALAAWQFQQRVKYLDAENKSYEAQYELVKSHISEQNEAIRQSNETLKNYQDKIAELRKEYDAKVTMFQKQVKNIKTCEDGYNYLKTMLEELKNAKFK